MSRRKPEEVVFKTMLMLSWREKDLPTWVLAIGRLC
jgi:hypothetical protein